MPWLKAKKGSFVGRCYVVHMMTDIGNNPMVIEYVFPGKNIYLQDQAVSFQKRCFIKNKTTIALCAPEILCLNFRKEGSL